MRAGLLAVALVGCTGGGGVAGRLEGIWVATDATEQVHRGLEIVELDAPVGDIRQGYTFWLYDVGDPPEAVQSGLFSVVDDEVLYDVRWDVDALNIGIRFAGTLERVSRDEILLDGRSYVAMDALPPGPPVPTAFGEVHWAATVMGGLGVGLGERPDGGAVVGTSAISVQTATVVGAGGEPVRQANVDLPTGMPAGLVAFGDEIGLGSGLGTGRYGFETTPGDAFIPEQTVTVPVWESPRGCFDLVAAGEVWVGSCVSGGVQSLVGIDPEDGSALWERPIQVALASRNVWSLGTDVLVHRYGTSPTPDVHGERGAAGGLVLERVAPSGEVAWTLWSPGIWRIDDATSLADGTTVILVTVGEELPGGPTWSDGGTRLLAIDPDGRILWDRRAPKETGYGSALLGTDAGFMMALGAFGVDFGGDVGVVTGVDGRGDALALAAYDACGDLRDVVTFDDCSATCWGAVTASPAVLVHELVRAADGDVLMHASLTGRFALGADEVGSSDGASGVVARLVDPPVAPACDPDPQTGPMVEVQVTGPGSVEIPGLGTCAGTCAWPTERFAELDALPLPGPGAQVRTVSGACDALPCVLHADAPIISLNVEFELPDATLFPSSGHVWAVGAGPSHGFVAGVAGGGQQSTLDGVVVADNALGEGAFVAVFDAGGLVGHAPIPSLPTGPYPTEVTAQPTGSRAVMLSAGSDLVVEFDGTGILASTTLPAPPDWQHAALDGLGDAAVAGSQGNALVVQAVDGTWAHEWPTTVAPYVLELIGRPGGGFVLVARAGTSIEPVPGEVWTGPPNNLLLVRLGADGVVEGGGMPAWFGTGTWFTAWEADGSLFATTENAQDTSLPYGPMYAERFDLDGVYLDAVGYPQSPYGLYPWDGGVVGSNAISGPINPWGGADLSHRGGFDHAVAWFAPDGVYLHAGSMGSAGDELFTSGVVSTLAVQGDGAVWLHTNVDGGFALGRFPPP